MPDILQNATENNYKNLATFTKCEALMDENSCDLVIDIPEADSASKKPGCSPLAEELPIGSQGLPQFEAAKDDFNSSSNSLESNGDIDYLPEPPKNAVAEKIRRQRLKSHAASGKCSNLSPQENEVIQIQNERAKVSVYPQLGSTFGERYKIIV